MENGDDRAKAIHAACQKDCMYADPQSPEPIRDIASLVTYVGHFSQNAPGWQATPIAISETAGMARATVAFGGQGPDGSQMVQHGQYFVEISGDKISRMVGFVGTGSPE